MSKIDRPGRLRGLYAITPETGDLDMLVRLVRCALDGGARLVQYRSKRQDAQTRLLQAQAIRAICRERDVPFIVNDDLELAAECGADGVHLGRGDHDPHAARLRLPHAILGVSCYDDPGRARAAARAGADYAAIGSVFASSTKPEAVHSGLAVLAEARRVSGIPIAAIGGITRENAAATVAAGADMIAVISALFEAPDVTAAAHCLSRPFDTESDPHVRAQQAAL